MWQQLSRLARLLHPQPNLLANSVNNSILSKISASRYFSLLSTNTFARSVTPMTTGQLTTPLLQVPSIAMNFERGMKVKGRLRRRCKDCYFIYRHERLYVLCKTHPRHKAMQMKKKEKNTWILTDATQSKKRAW